MTGRQEDFESIAFIKRKDSHREPNLKLKAVDNIMKKTLLALAVVAAAGSANAAEILKTDNGSADFYGQLRPTMTYSPDADSDRFALKSSSSRIGVNASYTATEGFDVLGKVELGVAAESSSVNVRIHTFGFATDFGTVTFGKDWTTSDDLGGTDYSYFFGGTGNLYSVLNGALNDSQIKYRLDLDNWFVQASYGVNDGSSNQDLTELFAGATYGDLSFHFGAGYNQLHNVTTTSVDISNTYVEGTVVYGLLENLELSGTVYGAKFESDAGGEIDSQALSLGAYWTFMEKTSLYGGVELTKSSATDILNDADGDFTNAFVGVEYMFDSWARVFFETGYADGDSVGFLNSNDIFVSDGHVKNVDKEINFGLGARIYW